MSAESFPEPPEAAPAPPQPAKSGHISLRTCVGCRQTGPATLLVCLVLSQGAVTPAPRRGRTGRGAWVHPSSLCLTKAVKAKAFDRAFRVAVRSVDAEALCKALESAR